jgi:hypothetical protein
MGAFHCSQASLNTTALACRYTRAERIGIDGLMVLPAMVYKADRREPSHFRRWRFFGAPSWSITIPSLTTST